MRNLILTLCSFVVLTSAVQAKMTFDDSKSFQTARVLKIGRSSAKLSTNISTLSSSGSLSSDDITYINPCDDNCVDCNYSLEQCRACADGYFTYNTAAKPGCNSICVDVVCRSGFDPSPSGNTCTCK